jgi:hypothetical protein
MDLMRLDRGIGEEEAGRFHGRRSLFKVEEEEGEECRVWQQRISLEDLVFVV